MTRAGDEGRCEPLDRPGLLQVRESPGKLAEKRAYLQASDLCAKTQVRAPTAEAHMGIRGPGKV
jgi:hypothetical protein